MRPWEWLNLAKLVSEAEVMSESDATVGMIESSKASLRAWARRV